MFSRRIKLTAIGILLCLTAVLSVSGYVFEIFREILPTDAHKAIFTIIDLFTTVNDTFSAHPFPLSLFFLGLAVLDDLYYAFKYGNSQNDLSVRIGKFVKYLLTGLNILCCVNLLDTEGLNQKFAWVQGNKKTVIITVAITVACIIFIELLQKNISAKHEQSDIHQAIQNNPNGVHTQNPPSAIIRHPFAYAYENWKIETAKDIVRSTCSTFNSTNTNQTGQRKQHQNSFFHSSITQILSWIFFCGMSIGLLALIVVGVRKIVTGEIPLQTLTQGLEKIKETISLFNSNADPIKIAALTFLLSIGTIISVVLIFFVLIYGFTFIFRAWLYMLKHISDDEEEIRDFYNAVETFFADSVRSVLHLLIFFPDFLETVEETVLDPDDLNK